MSDTPRTDAEFFSATTEKPSSGDFELEVVYKEFAQKLELELAQVTAYNTELVALNDHRVFARERAIWEERYKALDSVRYHLGIKLNVAQADAAALRAVLAEITETAGLREFSTAANAAYLAALNKARQMLRP